MNNLNPLIKILSYVILIAYSLNIYAEDYPIALTHIDTISLYCNKIKADNIEVDFLNTKGPLILSTAIWIPRDINGANEAADYTTKLASCIMEKVKRDKDVIIIKSKSDVYRAINEKKTALILTLEGGEPLEDIKNIKILKELGIKSVSLTWSRDNSLATAHNTKSDLGLSPKGKEVIRLLNDNRIMIDISHASDKTISDILNISTLPIYASHSNARAICNNNRNLLDKHIKEICSRGGIIGINFHSPHLSCKDKSTIDDIYKHINHIKKIGGTKCIAIGSDFDGHIKTPSDLKNLNDITKLVQKLKSENWTEEEIKGILYYNYLRYFESIIND